MRKLDESKRSRHGPSPLDASEKRDHCVSVRLNRDELALLDFQRRDVKMQRGEYLRAASLHRLPPTIPEINRAVWVELARAAANLNQIARHFNESDRVIDASEVDRVRDLLNEFRRGLIGVRDHEDEG